MLTMYELKQNSCFRCCYKTPMVRNIFLMMALSMMMLVIYVMYFYQNTGDYNSMLKVMKGLGSNTFNYLEQNAQELKAGDPVPVKMDK